MKLLMMFHLLGSSIFGCGGAPRSTPGGTEGVVTIGNGNLVVADVELTFYPLVASNPNSEPIGRGVSDSEGRFQLRSLDGRTSIVLPLGDYAITAISVAADPITMDASFSSLATTTLRLNYGELGKPVSINLTSLR